MNYRMVVRGSAAKDVLEAFFWYHTIRPQLGDRSMVPLFTAAALAPAVLRSFDGDHLPRSW